MPMCPAANCVRPQVPLRAAADLAIINEAETPKNRPRVKWTHNTNRMCTIIIIIHLKKREENRYQSDSALTGLHFKTQSVISTHTEQIGFVSCREIDFSFKCFCGPNIQREMVGPRAAAPNHSTFSSSSEIMAAVVVRGQRRLIFFLFFFSLFFWLFYFVGATRAPIRQSTKWDI